jgi:hypothetical protein
MLRRTAAALVSLGLFFSSVAFSQEALEAKDPFRIEVQVSLSSKPPTTAVDRIAHVRFEKGKAQLELFENASPSPVNIPRTLVRSGSETNANSEGAENAPYLVDQIEIADPTVVRTLELLAADQNAILIDSASEAPAKPFRPTLLSLQIVSLKSNSPTARANVSALTGHATTIEASGKPVFSPSETVVVARSAPLDTFAVAPIHSSVALQATFNALPEEGKLASQTTYSRQLRATLRKEKMAARIHSIRSKASELAEKAKAKVLKGAESVRTTWQTLKTPPTVVSLAPAVSTQEKTETQVAVAQTVKPTAVSSEDKPNPTVAQSTVKPARIPTPAAHGNRVRRVRRTSQRPPAASSPKSANSKTAGSQEKSRVAATKPAPSIENAGTPPQAAKSKRRMSLVTGTLMITNLATGMYAADQWAANPAQTNVPAAAAVRSLSDSAKASAANLKDECGTTFRSLVVTAKNLHK